VDNLSVLYKRFLVDEPYRLLTGDELWAKVRDGSDEAAFRVFLERVGTRIYLIGRAVLGDDTSADEAFQETFCALVRHRGKLPTYRAAVAWLYVTARSQARMIRRRQWRWRVRDQRRAATATLDTPDAATAPAEAEHRSVVLAAVGELPASQRRVVELVYLEGMTHAEAADALGWSRGVVSKYVQRGLERLRRALSRHGLAVAGVAAVEATLRADAVGVPTPRLAALADGAWAKAQVAGTWWAIGSWRLAACVAVGVGLTVGGVALWPRPDAPVTPPPTAEQETLQAKNLRILKDEVLPRVVAEIEGLGLTPPDVTWRVDGKVTAFGSRVFIPLEPSRKIAFAPEKIHLLFCTQQRTLWGHTYEKNRWMKIRPESPLMYDVPLPLFGSRYGLFELRFPHTAKTARAIKEAFERIPREERTEPEMVRWAFGPSGWTGEEFTIPGATWGPVMGNSRDLFAFDGYELYVRRSAGGWRHWRAKMADGQMAVTDTHLYCVLDRGVAALRLDDPAAPPERVCDIPSDQWRSIAVADDTIYITTEKAGEWFHRPLRERTASWTRHENTTAPLWVAAAGREVFFADAKTLFRQRAGDPNAPLTPLVPVPVPSPKLVAWGDRMLAVPQKEGPIYTRPLTAGSEVGWEEFGRIHPYTD
jgi:RNA polymerase sigma factor (sigma-70 family)